MQRFLLRAPGARHRGALRLEPVHWLLAGGDRVRGRLSPRSPERCFSNSEFFRLFDRFGVAPFLMFTIAPLAFPTERTGRSSSAPWSRSGGYLGLTALFETVGPHALVFPRYITNPDLGYHVGRARGPFLEAEANGIALFFCGAAAAVAATTWRGRRPGQGALLARRLPLLRGLSVQPLSRGLGGGGGGHLPDSSASFARSGGLLVPALIGIPLVVVLLISLVPGLAASIDERGNDKSSLWDRENLNAAALRMVEARPLLGFGWGRFTDVSPPYFWQAEDRPLTAVGAQSCDSLPAGARQTTDGSRPQCTVPVHNAYLSNAAELGLIGVDAVDCGRRRRDRRSDRSPRPSLGSFVAYRAVCDGDHVGGRRLLHSARGPVLAGRPLDLGRDRLGKRPSRSRKPAPGRIPVTTPEAKVQWNPGARSGSLPGRCWIAIGASSTRWRRSSRSASSHGRAGDMRDLDGAVVLDGQVDPPACRLPDRGTGSHRIGTAGRSQSEVRFASTPAT